MALNIRQRRSTNVLEGHKRKIALLRGTKEAYRSQGNLYNQLIESKKENWSSKREEFFGTEQGKKIKDISTQYKISGRFSEEGTGGVIEGGLESFLTKNNKNLGKGLGIVREGQAMLKKEQDTMAWMNKPGFKSGHYEERERTKWLPKIYDQGFFKWAVRMIPGGKEKYQHWVDTTASDKYVQRKKLKIAEEGTSRLESTRTGLGKSFGELVADINQYKSATGSQSYKDYMKLGTAYEKEMGGLEASRKSIEEGYTTALAQIKGQQDFLKRYSSSMSAYSAGGKDPKKMSDRELRKEEKKRGQIGQGYA